MSMTIGLTGLKQSGKDTAAKGLLALGWERAAFADKLKAVALAADPFIAITAQDAAAVGPVEFSWNVEGVKPTFHRTDYLRTGFARLSQIVEQIGWELAKKIAEVRRFLQDLGTEGVRNNLGFDTWVDAAMRELESGVDYVFTDVRFANEVEAVHRAGGSVIRIWRPGQDEGDGHASEQLDDLKVDCCIINNSTPHDLMWEVARFAYGYPEEAKPWFFDAVALWIGG